MRCAEKPRVEERFVPSPASMAGHTREAFGQQQAERHNQSWEATGTPKKNNWPSGVSRYKMSLSPRRRSLPDSVEGTWVLVARR
jgi:hypothetical protein